MCLLGSNSLYKIFLGLYGLSVGTRQGCPKKVDLKEFWNRLLRIALNQQKQDIACGM